MIVKTVFLLNLNRAVFSLVRKQEENCHHDHIPFTLKGMGNLCLHAKDPQAARMYVRGTTETSLLSELESGNWVYRQKYNACKTLSAKIQHMKDLILAK